MAKIRAQFTFHGAKRGAEQEFIIALQKSYPRSLNFNERIPEITLSIQGSPTPQEVKEMLKSFVPIRKIVSYEFKVAIDNKSFIFEGS